MSEAIRKVACEEIRKQSENCMLIFIKKPTWVGVVLTCLAIIGAAIGWTAFGMNHERRIVTLEQKTEVFDRTVNAKLDELLKRVKADGDK